MSEQVEDYAITGFSANGVDCVEGESILPGTFDKQVRQILVDMLRIGTRVIPPVSRDVVETETGADPGDGTNRAVKGGKGVTVPNIGLPGLTG